MVKDRKIRMIALDLDYTTLRNDKSLSPRTERALREAAAAGVHVVAATGRTFSALPPAILCNHREHRVLHILSRPHLRHQAFLFSYSMRFRQHLQVLTHLP